MSDSPPRGSKRAWASGIHVIRRGTDRFEDLGERFWGQVASRAVPPRYRGLTVAHSDA
jgi:hypothetical protein